MNILLNNKIASKIYKGEQEISKIMYRNKVVYSPNKQIIVDGFKNGEWNNAVISIDDSYGALKGRNSSIVITNTGSQLLSNGRIDLIVANYGATYTGISFTTIKLKLKDISRYRANYNKIKFKWNINTHIIRRTDISYYTECNCEFASGTTIPTDFNSRWGFSGNNVINYKKNTVGGNYIYENIIDLSNTSIIQADGTCCIAVYANTGYSGIIGISDGLIEFYFIINKLSWELLNE